MESKEPKYATVLPDYLDIKMEYSTFKYTVIIILSLLTLIIIGLIIFGINWVQNAGQIKIDPETDPRTITRSDIIARVVYNLFGIHDSPGATVVGRRYRHINDAKDLTTKEMCTSAPHATWDPDGNGGEGKCSCDEPFWGRKCEREAYSEEFIAIGNIDPNNLDYILSKVVDRQSFVQNLDQTTCDELCFDDPDCKGYVITPAKDPDQITCNLIDEEPQYFPDIVFNPNSDSNLFLKKTDTIRRLKLPDQVILFDGILRPRFWLENFISSDNHNMVNIGIGVLNKLTFHPLGIVNDGGNLIVFSNQTFKYEDALKAIKYYYDNQKQLQGWHVYIPEDTSFNPPYTWGLNNYWVMAISPWDYTRDIGKINNKVVVQRNNKIKNKLKPQNVILPPKPREKEDTYEVSALNEKIAPVSSSEQPKNRHLNTESMSFLSGWTESN